MTSLSFVLGGIYFTLMGRYAIAGLVLVASMLVRQTNVVWLCFCWLLIFYQEFGGIREFFTQYGQETKKKVWRLSIKTALFPIGIVMFFTFVYLNQGVAIGDAASHKIERIHFTQVYLWLFVVFLVLLPMHIYNLPKIVRFIKKYPECLLIVSMGFALYFLTFWAEHGYNTIDFFLRNKFIIWLKANDFNKIIISFFMLFALLSLAVSPLRHHKFYYLYPIMVVCVIPHALVEQRYFMETIALLMLFLSFQNRKVQIATLALYIPLTTYLCSGISNIQFFL